MTLTIRYHAQTRQAVGHSVETLTIPGPLTLPQLLTALADLRGDRLRALLLTDTGHPHPSLLLFVGDQQLRPDSPHTFSQDTELTLLSPIAGG